MSGAAASGGTAAADAAGIPEEAVPSAPVAASAELSLRTVGVGLAVGGLLVLTNLYSGLKTGVWETGAVLASLLSFVLLRASARAGTHSPLQDNFSQTLAVAAGGMPATAGLLGALPALGLLGQAPSLATSALLGVLLGLLGVTLAVWSRRSWMDNPSLPFPSGRSTAEVLTSLHAAGRRLPGSARSLLGAGLGSMGLTWLRVGPLRLLPDSSHPGLRIGPSSAAELTLGFAWSPLLAGVGMVIGPRIAGSVLAGGLLARAVTAPWLLSLGLVPDAGYGAITERLIWPATGLLVGATVPGTLASLFRQVRAAGGGQLSALRRRPALAVGLLLLPVAVAAVLGAGFSLTPTQALLALVLSVPLALGCARAAGETDVAPVGPTAQLGQATLGLGTSGQVAQNLAGGAVIAGVATQLGVGMGSFKTGQLLGASPARQTLAQVAGILWGAAVALPAYAALAGGGALGSERLPAPGAVQWRVFAEVASGGTPFQLGTWGLFALGVLVGALLHRLSSHALGRWAPSPLALGIGLLLPASYSATLWVGALAGRALNRRRPGAAASVGSGLIAGEALMAVLVAGALLL